MKALKKFWMNANDTQKAVIKSGYIIVIATLAVMLLHGVDRAFGLTKKANTAMDSKVVVLVVKK